MHRTSLKLKPKTQSSKPTPKHKAAPKHTLSGIDVRHYSSSPDAWASSFSTCIRRLHADRLILANVARNSALSTAAATIGSVGPAVGSSDDHAAELMRCKSIIKQMYGHMMEMQERNTALERSVAEHTSVSQRDRHDRAATQADTSRPVYFEPTSQSASGDQNDNSSSEYSSSEGFEQESSSGADDASADECDVGGDENDGNDVAAHRTQEDTTDDLAGAAREALRIDASAGDAAANILHLQLVLQSCIRRMCAQEQLLQAARLAAASASTPPASEQMRRDTELKLREALIEAVDVAQSFIHDNAMIQAGAAERDAQVTSAVSAFLHQHARDIDALQTLASAAPWLHGGVAGNTSFTTPRVVDAGSMERQLLKEQMEALAELSRGIGVEDDENDDSDAGDEDVGFSASLLSSHADAICRLLPQHGRTKLLQLIRDIYHRFHVLHCCADACRHAAAATTSTLMQRVTLLEEENSSLKMSLKSGSPLHNDRAPSGDMDGGRRAALEGSLAVAQSVSFETASSASMPVAAAAGVSSAATASKSTSAIFRVPNGGIDDAGQSLQSQRQQHDQQAQQQQSAFRPRHLLKHASKTP